MYDFMYFTWLCEHGEKYGRISSICLAWINCGRDAGMTRIEIDESAKGSKRRKNALKYPYYLMHL